MKNLHIKNGKFAPQSDEEYEAICYLLDEDLFCFDYLRPEVRKYVNRMTEEEKNFVRLRKNLLTNP